MQDQPEGTGELAPPALEAPSPASDPRVNRNWSPALQESVRAMLARVAMRSGPPATLGATGAAGPPGEAPEGPTPIVHEGETSPHLLFSPPAPAQLVLTAGTEPLLPPAQRGFDLAWYKPPEAPEPEPQGGFDVASNSIAPAPAPAPAQDPLPLPRPWLDLDGPLFDLLHGAEFLTPDYGTTPKADQGELFDTPGDYLRALAASWGYIARCFERYGAPAGLLEYARKRAGTVGQCGTRWGNVWQCDTCGHVDKRQAINLTKCESRMCPFCAKVRRGRWVAPMFAYAQRYRVMPRTAESKGHLSRDYYMDTITEVKPPTVTLRGLRASVTAIKKKWPKVARLAGYLPRDKDWPDAKAWEDAKVRFAAEMEAAKALPPTDRKLEQKRIRTERAALWKRHQHKWPGECEEFGMLATIDMDMEAFIHAHVLRYGSWVWADDMREVCGGTWTRITPVRPKYRKGHEETDEEAMAHAIFESVKYPGKLTTKPGSHHYTHPMLAAMFEAATCGMRLTEGYGTMRGLVPEDESDEGGDEEEQPEEPTDCPKCGNTKLTAVVLTFAMGTWVRTRPAKGHAHPTEPTVKVRLGGPGSELVEMTVSKAAELFAKGRPPPGG